MNLTNETIMMAMAPAPVRRATPRLVDLGQFDESYTGWQVYVNPKASIEVNETLASIQDDSVPAVNKVQAIYLWISECFIQWNFTIEKKDQATGGTYVAAMKQPGFGGEKEVDMELLGLLSQAYSSVIQPGKNF